MTRRSEIGFADQRLCRMRRRYKLSTASLKYGRNALLGARPVDMLAWESFGEGRVTAFLWPSAWPDLLIGFGIAVINADGTREVWRAAREEQAALG